MKLLRFTLDSFLFIAPMYYPRMLYLYLFMHFSIPWAVYLPKKLDRLDHPMNVPVW